MKRSAAIREAVTARRIALDKQEIASAKAKAAALAQTDFQGLRSQDESNRYQYTLRFGSTDGYKPDPALAQAENQSTKLTKEHSDAVTNATAAQRDYDLSRKNSVAIGKAATAEITSNTVANGGNTASIHANTAAETTNTASTGKLSRAKNICTKATKAMGEAIAANPFGAAIFAVTLLITGLMSLSAWMEKVSQDRLENAQKEAEAARKAREEGDKQQEKHEQQASRLEKLSKKQNLSNMESKEAYNLLRSLGREYKGFGVSMDGVTGKLVVQAGAFENLRKQMQKVAEERKKNEVAAIRSEMDAVNRRYMDKNASRGPLTWMRNVDRFFMGKSPLDSWKLGDDSGLNLKDFSDEQLRNMAQLENSSAEAKQMIADVLRMRNELKDIEGSAEETEVDRRLKVLSVEKEISEQKRAAMLADEKAALLADGRLSKADELRLLEMEIAHQKERAAEADKTLIAAKGGSEKQVAAADQASAEAHLKLAELETQAEEANRNLALELKEIERERVLAKQRAVLAADGELSKADELLLLKTQISQQEERVLELQKESARVANSAGKGSVEHRAALRDEEQARARQYELQREQKQAQISHAKEQRELKQQLELNQKIIALRADGEYSVADQIEVQKLKLEQMGKNIEDTARRLKEAKTDDEKLKLQVQLSEEKIAKLSAEANLKTLQDGNKKAVGSFSTALLNAMIGANSPQQETAQNTKDMKYELRRMRSDGVNVKEKYKS